MLSETRAVVGMSVCGRVFKSDVLGLFNWRVATENSVKTHIIFESFNEVSKQTTFRNAYNRDNGCRENTASVY